MLDKRNDPSVNFKDHFFTSGQVMSSSRLEHRIVPTSLFFRGSDNFFFYHGVLSLIRFQYHSIFNSQVIHGAIRICIIIFCSL